MAFLVVKAKKKKKKKKKKCKGQGRIKKKKKVILEENKVVCHRYNLYCNDMICF